jgi:hypothetical protein
MSDEPQGQITMSRIPIRGGVGAFVLIVILVAGVLGELPQLRLFYLGAMALGLLFALALILWRRRTIDSQRLPPGARTMFVPEPITSDRATRSADDTRGTRAGRPINRPGAHPRVVPAS